jgi:hypothetical protein
MFLASRPTFGSVVSIRQDRFVTNGELSGLPDLHALQPAWHERAACAGETDDKVFFSDIALYKTPETLASAAMLLPLAICSTCDVRCECTRRFHPTRLHALR